jgi:hypothetical protein
MVCILCLFSKSNKLLAVANAVQSSFFCLSFLLNRDTATALASPLTSFMNIVLLMQSYSSVNLIHGIVQCCFNELS